MDGLRGSPSGGIPRPSCAFGGCRRGCRRASAAPRTALGAKAIVVLSPDASDGLAVPAQHPMQLASKMRFVSAQLLALLEGDLYREPATPTRWPASARAASSGSGPASSRESRALRRRRRAAIFASCRGRGRPSCAIASALRLGCLEGRGALGVRLRTSRADVDAFLEALRAELHRLMPLRKLTRRRPGRSPGPSCRAWISACAVRWRLPRPPRARRLLGLDSASTSSASTSAEASASATSSAASAALRAAPSRHPPRAVRAATRGG